MLNARYYENGRYTGSRKRSTLAELMRDHPRHEVQCVSEPGKLIAILRDTGSSDSVIRVYDPKLK